MARRVSRRTVLRGLAMGGVSVAGCLGQSSPRNTSPTTTPDRNPSPTPRDSSDRQGVPPAVGLEPVATGFQSPVAVAFLPDSTRCYIVDRPGVVYLNTADGVREEPVLDIRDQVETGGERGLLGIALHPAFRDTDRVFLRYSSEPREGTPSTYSHTFVLAEYSVTPDRTSFDRDSERTLLEIPQPQRNHNAGDIVFGPDGYLYVPVGDGGGGNDQGTGHVEDWYEPVGGGNGQDVTTNLLGSLLRIDIDTRSDTTPYGIPPDNPLVDRPGFDEHYAWGFRNPWRLSFDNTDLYVGDVGQNRYEEVDLVEKGGNYGWNIKEGTHCLQSTDCPNRTPSDVRGGERLIDPIIEYAHSGTPINGISVIGGYVYRGAEHPGLTDRYVFGDLRPNGRLFVGTRPQTEGLWPVHPLPIQENDAGALTQLVSFGRDLTDELYVLGTGSAGGGLYKLVTATETG